MNYNKIADMTQSAGMYKLLADKEVGFPENFYCVLVGKIAPTLLDKKKKQTEGQGESTFRVLGNEIAFQYPKLGLSINLQTIPAEGKGMEWLKDAVIKCFAMEADGTLKIKRPEGHDRSTDRLDFKKCNATFLPTIEKQVAYASGKQDLGAMKKGTANRKSFLSAEDYEKYKPQGFDERSNSVCTYYTKHGINVIDVTGKCDASRAMFAVNNPGQPKSAELLARTCPELGDMLTDPSETNPYYVVVSGKEAFNVEMSLATKEPKVSNINVTKAKEMAEEQAKKVKPKDIDPVALAFDEWCHTNNKPRSEKSFNEFKELPENKQLFDSAHKKGLPTYSYKIS